jgi:hypothetical protein
MVSLDGAPRSARRRVAISLLVAACCAAALFVTRNNAAAEGEGAPAAKVATKSTSAAGDNEKLFRERVAVILERRCVHCHSGDTPKGKLRLDEAKAALAGGESGAAIEPGDADASLLLDYVSGEEPEMPKGGKPLSADEVAALREWIAGGAAWPAGMVLQDKRLEGQTWWSLEPLARPAVPTFADSAKQAWVRTPVDAFILQMLDKQGLHPSAEADRRTLIRRLTFDLHGLPPTPEAIDAFVSDKDPQAYEKLVDRLLESPRYGERWGRHWLDTVHYGDTHGYDKDKVRPNAWPYRDYVIRAFNEGKRYSQFVMEQLAGDVIAPNSRDGVVATGFIVAGPWDYVGHVELREGTTDKNITRSLDRDDMVMNTMSTFTSLTVHCARCHNHKFDPIPQKDYYRLQAVFAGVERANRPYDADPAVAARRGKLLDAEAALVKRQAGLAETVRKLKPPKQIALDRRIAALQASASRSGAALPAAPNRTLGYHSAIEKTADVTTWVQVDLKSSRPIEQVVLFPADEAYGGHPGPGFGFPPRFKIEASDDASFANGVSMIVDRTAADVPNPGDAPLLFALPKPLTARYVRVTATKLWERTADYALAISEVAVLSGGKNVATAGTVSALDSIEAGGAWGKRFLIDGMFGLTSFAQAAKAGASSPTNGYHSAIVSAADYADAMRDGGNASSVEKWVQVNLGESTTLDELIVVPARPTDFADTPGFGFPPRLRIAVSDDATFGKSTTIYDQTQRDLKNPGDEPLHISAEALRGARGRYVRVTATRLWKRTDDFVFALAELQAWKAGENLAASRPVTARDSIEAGRWSTRHLVDGYSSRASLAADAGLFAELARGAAGRAELQVLVAQRDALAKAAIPPALSADVARVEGELTTVRKQLGQLPPQQTVYAAAHTFAPEGSFAPAPGGKPREIHLLKRGNVNAPAELVTPGAASCVTALGGDLSIEHPGNEGERRLALAKWIVDPKNPLTWRSIVNRVWQFHFGAGLAAMPNDFGRMGAEPTHPALLDWLAVEFRDGDQSLKSLHKLLVTSSVYRQVSTEDPKQARLDAGNRYLWRMNRRRLEAEASRDATLAVAGKLDLSMGGPGFREFGFRDDHSPHYLYQEHDPDDPATCRRSVYRFIVRSVPDPFMDTLDCADASALVARRNETVTPLQALALLNNKFMLQMSQHFAERAAKLSPTIDGQVDAAFRLALGRRGDPTERWVLIDYAKKHGLANACRVILNMNEFVFVD